MAIRAQYQQVRGFVRATLSYRDDVVHFERENVTASRGAAHIAGFKQDGLLHCG